jgi:predicted aspartyl protease
MPIVDQPLRALQIGNDLLKPYLNVSYINPHTGKSLKTAALIDTGADHCILPAGFAAILGHNFAMGHPTQVNGVSGQSNTLYQHTMKIKIDGHDFITDDVLIAFGQNLHTPIIGVRTFLSNFVLTINYPGKKFSLRLPVEDENLLNWPMP